MLILLNRIRRLAFFVLLCVAWILTGTSAAGQAPAPAHRVLMLYSDERLLPATSSWMRPSSAGLRS